MGIYCLPCCAVSDNLLLPYMCTSCCLSRWHLQLRRACSKANNELAAVSEDRANLHEQHQKAQESIDALVAELQDTLARLEQEQKQAGLLSDKLQQLSADAAAKQKQVRMCLRGLMCLWCDHCLYACWTCPAGTTALLQGMLALAIEHLVSRDNGPSLHLSTPRAHAVGIHACLLKGLRCV